MLPFTEKVVEIIRSIPSGKVATYGMIATMAGNRRSARQVARILHACSHNAGLPWHRVVNKQGMISLKQGSGFNRQKDLLITENVSVNSNGKVDLEVHLWRPNGSF